MPLTEEQRSEGLLPTHQPDPPRARHAADRPLRSRIGGWIYFLQDERGRIKIGHAKDLTHRFQTIQTGNADELRIVLAYEIEDAAAEERRVHALFNDSRIRGEWFRCTRKMRIFIQRTRDRLSNAGAGRGGSSKRGERVLGPYEHRIKGAVVGWRVLVIDADGCRSWSELLPTEQIAQRYADAADHALATQVG